MNQKAVFFSTRIISSNTERLDFLNKFTAFCKEKDVSLKCTEYEFFLILDEALSNAMEHGNHWNENKNVYIECSIQDKLLHIEIQDEGPGFNYLLLDYNPKTDQALKPRGRGIYIMQKFCKVSWENSGRTICLDLELQ